MYNSINRERGFSMLEVLISMLVIMIGALGIAGMQLLAITSTENARYQNVATMLGGSLAAAMQANVAYWGSPPATITVLGSTITGGPAAFTGSCLGATTCSKTEMASYDLKVWGAEVAAQLPSGGATIVCPQNISPAICSVTLTWKERNVVLHNASDTGTETGSLASGTNQDNKYQTLVSIL